MNQQPQTSTAKKGLFRIVFSRTGIILLLLAAQIALMFGTIYYLHEYIHYVYGTLVILQVIALIYLINAEGNPAFKMTWMLCILAFPLFGVVFYIFVKMQLGTRYMRDRLAALKIETDPYMTQDPDVIEAIWASKSANANLAYYLSDKLGFPTYRNTDVKYFPLGEYKFKALVQELQKAKKFIFMEYFIVEKGYMWGTTGLVYNPEYITEEQLELGWALMLDESVKGKVTTKDNVRDSYFVGLAILFEEELLDLKARHEAGELSDADYTAQVTDYMNRTDEETVAKVQQILLDMKENLFGFETDTGKHDMVTGTIWLNFAWSGDAVYAMDVAEDAEDGEGAVTLNYYMPEESANLWFDGWVIPKDEKRTEETKHAAEAFVNFLSAPENAVRNSYYIGYTSVIAGDEMFDYMADTYSAEDGDETATDYDLSYFFGEGDYVISAPAEQLERQLYAQYPPEEEMLRCAVMDYYGENDERINELWTQIKGETLDAWAIGVICAAVVLIAVGVLYMKLGPKTDFFRHRPKKGYKKVSSVPVSYQK